ncbi:MAG: class I SAM-dependent methyltransferase [Rhodospirillaceae bacterium]|nr:class I SAM-dependent methyltransferase [Rhodospirillaceae bacterium]
MEAGRNDAAKAAVRAQWDRHAQGWNEHRAAIAEWLRGATDAMLAMAEVRPGARVLDVAAGAGDQTLDIARRVGERGFVLATDLSPAILDFAREQARRAGLRHVETRASDGETLDIGEARFDAAVCRLGLMFFPDPGRGLRAMFDRLELGGRACTLVFSTPEANPCIAILMATALKHAGLPPRDPYQPGGLLSLGKPGHIDALFRAAGFERVATTRLAAPFRLPSVRTYVQFLRDAATPILHILRNLDERAQDAAWSEIESRLRAFEGAQGWEGPNELLLTVGRKPAP